MKQTEFEKSAQEIAKKTGFVLKELIYCGACQDRREKRNVIFDGFYKGKPAVLKIYDGIRLDLEPVDQQKYNEVNKSSLLKAPEVYLYETTTPLKGWLIMEKFPEGSASFSQPVDDKAMFAELYLEYRLNFPTYPTRMLSLAENLSAVEFATVRIGRWFEMATNAEAMVVLSGEAPLLVRDEFIWRYEKALALIRKELGRRELIWCHGHFKPHELFKNKDAEGYYLTDFAHTHMYPEGYELGFVVWADWIMSADWKLPYEEWKKGIDEWKKALKPIADKLGIKDYDSLFQASLAERTLGAILADVCASDRPREEKEKRIALLYRLLDDILSL